MNQELQLPTWRSFKKKTIRPPPPWRHAFGSGLPPDQTDGQGRSKKPKPRTPFRRSSSNGPCIPNLQLLK